MCGLYGGNIVILSLHVHKEGKFELVSRGKQKMGRKKRGTIKKVVFCYYCDREFDDEKVLIQHQKAKHFKCMSPLSIRLVPCTSVYWIVWLQVAHVARK